MKGHSQFMTFSVLTYIVIMIFFFCHPGSFILGRSFIRVFAVEPKPVGCWRLSPLFMLMLSFQKLLLQTNQNAFHSEGEGSETVF